MTDSHFAPLPFCSRLIFKQELMHGDPREQNIYTSWRKQLEGRDWFLVGQSENAFTITPAIGSDELEFISGDPHFLFRIDPPHLPTVLHACGGDGL